MERVADFVFGSLKIALGVYVGIVAVTHAAGPLWVNQVTVQPQSIQKGKGPVVWCELPMRGRDFDERSSVTNVVPSSK